MILGIPIKLNVNMNEIFSYSYGFMKQTYYLGFLKHIFIYINIFLITKNLNAILNSKEIYITKFQMQ